MDHSREFHNPRRQRQILITGTREALIEWLMWHDPNGIWSDADSLLEGKPPISLEQARKAMQRFLTDNRTVSVGFDPILPLSADAETCERWLRQTCLSFGLGFHLDTPASDYLSEFGTPLSKDVAANLEHSINRVFDLLGNDRPYIVCMEAFEAMLKAAVQ